MAGLVNAKLDERSYDRAMERLAKYEGRPLKARMEAAYRAGLGLAVAPMRRAAPKQSGKLSRAVSVRKGRPTMGAMVRYGTKSRAPHAGIIAGGHRIVTPGGRATGRRWPGDPFVSNVIASYEGRIRKFITEATLDTNTGIRSFIE